MRDAVYYLAGLVFLVLAKLKHVRSGYSTPKPIDPADVEKCVAYDRMIADTYLTGADVRGKDVVELGPGSDLGIGILLVRAGARSYTAVDRHRLAGPKADAVHAAMGGLPPAVRYVVAPDFQFVDVVGEASVDLVVSNAAFEHFDDIPDVARQLARVVRPGGRILASIDLQTHSRWIREKDPANIYRYPRWLYRLFYFPGQPNRVRPAEFRRAFEMAGWKDVTTRPVAQTSLPCRAHRSIDPVDLDQMTIVLEGVRPAG